YRKVRLDHLLSKESLIVGLFPVSAGGLESGPGCGAACQRLCYRDGRRVYWTSSRLLEGLGARCWVSEGATLAPAGVFLVGVGGCFRMPPRSKTVCGFLSVDCVLGGFVAGVLIRG